MCLYTNTERSRVGFTVLDFQEDPMRFKIFKMGLRMALVAAVCAASVTTMLAQSAVDGAIGGTVEDKTGSVISGAKVVIVRSATNADQMLVSDASGPFEPCTFS